MVPNLSLKRQMELALRQSRVSEARRKRKLHVENTATDPPADRDSEDTLSVGEEAPVKRKRSTSPESDSSAGDWSDCTRRVNEEQCPLEEFAIEEAADRTELGGFQISATE